MNPFQILIEDDSTQLSSQFTIAVNGTKVFYGYYFLLNAVEHISC